MTTANTNNGPNFSTSVDILDTNWRSDLINKVSEPYFIQSQPSTRLSPSSQKLVNYQNLNYITGSGLIANTVHEFKIPKGLGYLAELVLEITLTTSTDQTNCASRLATHIYSDIQLCTVNGPFSIDRKLGIEYTNMRLDQLSTDQRVIIYGTDPPEPWTTGTVIVYCPLFFNFSESSDDWIDVNNSTDLILRCIVGNSSGIVGGVSSVTSFQIRCKQTFVNFPYIIYPAITTLKNISDVYFEKVVGLTAGSTSGSINITCQFPSFVVCAVIRDSSYNYTRIDNMNMSVMGQTIFDVNRASNYSLTTGSNEVNNVGSFVYWFSYEKSRKYGSPMGLNHVSNPLLSLSWSIPVGPNANLYVFFEHYDQLYKKGQDYIRINNY